MPENKEKKDEMVQVSRVELAQILEMNRRLTAQVGEPTPKPREIKDRKVVIFFINNEPVIGYVNKGSPNRPVYIYEKPDPNRPGEYLPYVDVLCRNTKDPVKLNYLEFLQESDRQECKILKTEWTEWTENQGRVQGRAFEEGTYNMSETGTIVPVEVKGKTAVFTVQLPDGSQLDIHERYCNINR